MKLIHYRLNLNGSKIQKSNYTVVNHHRRFTYYEKQNIKRFLRENMSYSEIAKNVGRTTESIRYAMKNGIIL